MYRFHKDANSPGYSQRDLFVNGVKTSIQQNDQNYELTSLAALMLMGCRPSGNGTDSIAFQMRLVEIYEGAVLNEKIIERTDQLRDEDHF